MKLISSKEAIVLLAKGHVIADPKNANFFVLLKKMVKNLTSTLNRSTK